MRGFSAKAERRIRIGLAVHIGHTLCVTVPSVHTGDTRSIPVKDDIVAEN